MDVIQCNFNFNWSKINRNWTFAYCKKINKDNCKNSFGFGFLTGKLTSSKEQFTNNDHRFKWPQEQLDLWASAHLEFKNINNNLSYKPLDLAHQFIKYYQPTVFTTICGMHSLNEVDENLNSYYHKEKLSEKEIINIQQIYKSKSSLLMELNQRSTIVVFFYVITN